MNISTATILNLLSPKLNENAKQKIDKLSVDGKVDLNALLKDKGIQSLLTGLFKEITNGTKTKDEVGTLLVNQKQNFSFKNLSEDLKTLIKTLDTQLLQNPKLETPLTALKTSLVDIHTLDEKVLKTSLSNSGVFLESKLANQSTPIAKHLEQLFNTIKNQMVISDFEPMLKQHSSTQEVPKNISSLSQLLQQIQTQAEPILNTPNIKNDFKLELKTAIDNLLRDVKNLKNEPNVQKQLQSFTTIETKVVQLLQSFEPKNIQPELTKELSNSLKDLLPTIKENITNKNRGELKNILTNLQQKIAVLSDDTVGVKNLKTELSNLFSQLKTIETLKVPAQQQTALQNFHSSSQLFQTRIEAFPQPLFENNISKTLNFINDLKLNTLNLEKQLESNLEPMSKELKTIIDKINTQIDFFQLLSFSTNSSHTYLAFLQDEIEDADVRFHKNKDDSFSCQINLSLSKFGDLKVLMVLEKENHISINIGVESSELKSMIQQNLQKLRLGINSVNLLIQSLNLFSLNENSKPSGKHIYSASNDFSFGVDIKV